MEYRADFLLGLIGFILVQLFTNFGKLLNNIFIHVGISIFIMILFYILSIAADMHIHHIHWWQGYILSICYGLKRHS